MGDVGAIAVVAEALATGSGETDPKILSNTVIRVMLRIPLTISEAIAQVGIGCWNLDTDLTADCYAMRVVVLR